MSGLLLGGSLLPHSLNYDMHRMDEATFLAYILKLKKAGAMTFVKILEYD